MRRLGLSAALFGVLAGACGSDPVNGAPPVTEPRSCDATSFADATLPAVTVGRVSASVHAPDGTPAVDVPVTVCGVDVCSSLEHTDDEGSASVTLSLPVTKPALKFGDGLHYAELAVLLEDAAGGAEFPELTLPALPDTGAPLVAGSSAESAGVTLTLAPRTTVTLDSLPPYDTEAARALRAAELAPEDFPEGLAHGVALERVFTLAPLGAVLCPPAALELPNSAGWEPGTPVEFLVQGFGVGVEDGDQPFAPYGEWQVVATGEVSASGTSLVSTSGGLPIVSNVGVRRP